MGCDGKDLLTPLCPLPGGGAVVSRHRPDHSETVTTIVPIKDGTPIPPGAEFVTTHRRSDGSMEITSSYRHGGPAQVATKSYRDGWERTFTARGGSA